MCVCVSVGGGVLNIQSLLDGIQSTCLVVSSGVFFEMQIFPFSFASVHQLIFEEVMGESVNNLTACSN